MALVGDTCVSIGNADWFRGDSVSISPTTVAPYDVVRVQRGSSSVISAENSFSEDSLDILYYEWEVVGHPDNLLIQHTGPSLDLDIRSIGEYEIELTAIGANGGCGSTVSIFLYSFSSDATQHAATALDTSWVWEMLPSAWSSYNQDLRLKAELFWRGMLQIVGSDVTKALAFDLNKGIANASLRRPARWLNFGLTQDISDCKVVIREPQTREIANIFGNAVELAEDFNRTRYASSFTCIVEDDYSIIVSQENGHTPMEFDLGGRVTIDINGRSVQREVISVDFFNRSLAMYTLDQPLLNVQTGDRFTCDLLCVAEPRNEVLTVNQDGRTVLTGILGGRVPFPNAASIIQGYLSPNDTSLTQNPYIVREGLWESGVRPDDVIVVKVTNLVTRNNVSVKLRIIDIYTGDDGLDYAQFEPFSGTFYDTIKGVIISLIPRTVGIFTEFKTYLKEILTRVSGVSLNPYSEYTVNTASQSNSLSVEFTHIIQRSALAVDPHIQELTTLREYIELQQMDPTDTYVLTEAKRAHKIGRKVITLLENRDFRVYPDPKRIEGLSYTAGNDYITCAQGDMTYTVRKGYTIDIKVGFGLGRYKVIKVTNDKIYVNPKPRLPFTDADGDVVRSGNYTVVEIEEESKLPVVNGIDTLWCESATVADYEELQSKFGVISDLMYKEWKLLDTDTDYLDLLRAIHTCSVKFSSIDDMRDLVSSILGIPYTKSNSLVRRIDIASRNIDDIVYDKVILEELNRDNQPNGVLRAHYVVSQSANNIPKNLGLMPYVRVGNVIPANTIIGRSVTVKDNLSELPTDRHTFEIKIAAGATRLNNNMIRFVKRKIDQLKPAYTDFDLIQQVSVSDSIEIVSDILFKLTRKLTDTPYGLHGPAEVLDDFIPGMGRIDTPPFYVLNTWFPDDGQLINEADGSLSLKSGFGGFVDAPSEFTRTMKVKVGDSLEDLSVIFNARYEGSEWIKPGDMVIFKNDHVLQPMTITDIVSDTHVALDTHGNHLLDTTNVSFLVIRFVDDLLLEVDNLAISTDLSISLDGQVKDTHNIARGDIVSFNTLGDVKRPIKYIQNNKIYLENKPYAYPPLSGDILTGGSGIRIRRYGIELFDKGDILISDMGLLNDYAGNVRILQVNGNAEYLGINIGDYLDAHLVLAIMPRRDLVCVSMDRSIVLDSPVSMRLTQPKGLLGHDALDLAESGVRSSVSIKIKPRFRRLHGVSVNADGDIINTGGILDHVTVEQGDLVYIEGDHSTVNTGEGIYAYRAINSSINNNNAFSINIPRGTIADNTLHYVEVIRQSPIKQFVREG